MNFVNKQTGMNHQCYFAFFPHFPEGQELVGLA